MIKRLFLFIVIIFLNFSINAQTLPNISNLSPNAKNELIDIVNIVFEKEKQDYGFLETDNINQIVIGKQFLLYFIPDMLIDILKTCSNVKDMADRSYLNNSIQSILYVNNRPVCLIDYYKKDDVFHIGGLTSTKLTDKLSYIITNCKNPIILTSYLKIEWYYSDEIDNYVQLYPLMSVSTTGLGKIAANSKNIFSLLDEIKRQAKNIGNN